MSFKSRVRPVADTVFTDMWGAGHWVRGRMLPAVNNWHSPGGQRVLVVAPHPDDEVAGCGGAIILHLRAGDQVTVLHVTDGRRSRSLGLGPEAMARQRQAEAKGSLKALGVLRWEWLGLPEGDWEDFDLMAALERELTAARPQVVYLPSRVDFHPEHYGVARVAAQVLSRSNEKTVVRVYHVQVPLTRILVNVVAPIAATAPDLLSACARYVSQWGSLRGSLRMKGYAARAHGLPGMAEEFWEMSGGSYAALHALEPPRPLVHTFRGLRRLALTDPLAFLRGRKERRRLLRLAASAER